MIGLTAAGAWETAIQQIERHGRLLEVSRRGGDKWWARYVQEHTMPLWVCLDAARPE